ncbi:hypothetical protein [Burkholderia sp. GbtcB21]|uniref:hypothetical protein n=1 Tax=Burkholderia sp. GbtcB21 TaxID=2824766 RepID=UPI001C304D29|nr:hypothetical protein [Burkholderia sp. GbtcB21]
MASAELIKAVAATAELCGTTMSQPAAELLLADLSSFDERAVLAALSKCRREVKGRLTVAEILSRIDDGRPGVEEAWAMLPRDEDSTTVWTTEMAEAWGLAREMIAESETVAARMAFKEAYQRLVNAAREARQPAKWSVSLGHDVNGRKGALLMAVAQKRITAEYACALLPNFAGEAEVPLMLPKPVGVIGPTHALQHFSEVDSDPHA